MPIGSTNVYNPGDLILSTVSGSGTSFIETKIIAATSSFILFNSSGTLTSASLNSIVATTSSYVSGSTSIITNLTASNISASGTGSFGMVGIGTTSPGALLDVNGLFRFQQDIRVNNGTDKLILSATSTTTELHSAGTTGTIFKGAGNNEIVRFDATNFNVGIGTTTVSRKLHVYVDTGPVMRLQSSGSNASIEFIPSIGHNRYNWLIGAQQNISDAFEITPSTATNGTTFSTPAVLVASSGNVGIGTTNPLDKLSVSGSIGLYAAGTTRIYNAINATDTISIEGAGGLTFKTYSGGFNTAMVINTSGNVGIGTTSPAARLEISGSSNSALFNIKSPISGNIIFVTGSGCVGINKSTPTATFDISGSTIITGSLNVSANITCLSLTETSTEAVKYNILPLPSQLDNVLKLKPVSFNYKANDKHSIGLIAEEVAKIYPEFTSDNNDSISYGKITSVLIQSIKELKTIIDNQQKQIENLIDKLK